MKAQAAADAAAAAKEEGLTLGPDGELNSHPKTGETLEAAQARVNGRGGDGGAGPAASAKKATDEVGDDEVIDEADEPEDGDAEDEDGDDAPFEPEVQTRLNRPGQASGR